MKATFFERLGAYFIDTLIVSVIFSIICLGVDTSTTNTEKLMEELDNKLLSGEITNKEYMEEYKDLTYDYQKDNILQLGISAALTVSYYVVFQYMNKGQTLGKKLLKIKVVDKQTEKPISIIKGLLRTFLIYSLLSGIASIICLYITNKETYFIIYFTLLIIEALFMLISAMFVLYKKDSRGLHDIISNTIVIKEGR